jgi:hypothetical protein
MSTRRYAQQPEVLDPVELIRLWRGEPELFVRQCLRVDRISTQQLDGLSRLRDLVMAKVRRAAGECLSAEEQATAGKVGISIMSGKGTGKDAFSAWVILWFLLCFQRPLIPCTAPTQHQLRDVLWSEINKWLQHSATWHRTAQSGFYIDDWLTWQAERVFLTDRQGRDWMAVARTASRHATYEEQKATLAGFHEEYLMVVADEASDIPDGVFAQLDDTLTMAVNFALVIFNPNHRSGFAVGTHGLSVVPQQNDRQRWMTLRWNAEDSENVTSDSVARKREKYGVKSNAYRVTVLGLPPVMEDDTLIPWDWVQDAVDRDVDPMDDDPVVVGIDVARYGSDKSVILVMRGPIVEQIYEKQGLDTEEVAGWAMGVLFDLEPAFTFVDTIGIGAGVADKLRHRTTFTIIDVNVQELPADDARFHRLRDELWWRLRERFENRDIRIPNDEELIGELTTPKYEMPDGQIKIWDKKKLKAMGLASPNKADALMLCQFYEPNYLRNRHVRRPMRVKGGKAIETWRTV